MMNELKKIVIIGGGTGGHVFPACSLYQYLFDKKFDVEIITDKRGHRFLKDFAHLRTTKFLSASIFGKNPLNLILSLSIIILTFLRSLIFFILNRPNIVFGMGGYTTFPICIAAKLLNIPFIIYENNLIIGKANRYLLPFAKKIFLSYSETSGIKLKYKNKIVVTGNIIRKEILDFKLNKVIENNKILNILVLGGSQAAKVFGEKLPEIFKLCKKNNIEINIFQQCYTNQKKYLEDFYNKNLINNKIFRFNSNIVELFKEIDFVITRSGASILGELLNCRIPLITIPLMSAADNHQYLNAKYFEENGYGFLVNENEIENNLFTLIKEIHKDKSILDQMINKQKNYNGREIFKKIYKEIESIIDAKN